MHIPDFRSMSVHSIKPHDAFSRLDPVNHFQIRLGSYRKKNHEVFYMYTDVRWLYVETNSVMRKKAYTPTRLPK